MTHPGAFGAVRLGSDGSVRPPMSLVEATADRLEFRIRRAPRPLALTGSLFFVLALLPLFAPGPLSVARIVMSALLGAGAALLLVSSRPRTERVFIDLAEQTVSVAGAQRAFGDAVALELGSGSDQHAPALRYRLLLKFGDGARATLLESAEPISVLRDLERALRRLPLPVLTGWGLPEAARPWEIASARADASKPATSEVFVIEQVEASQGPSAWTVIIGGLVVGALMAVMMIARLERGEQISPLSWALSIGTIAIVVGLGIRIAAQRVRVRLGSDLCIEHAVLGLRLARRCIPLNAIHAAHAVGPDPSEPRHVLLETSNGPVSFACAGRTALKVRDRVLSSIAEPNRAGPAQRLVP
jgi:hypothetical protein